MKQFKPLELTLFSLLGASTIASVLMAFYLQEYAMMIIPGLVLVVLMTINSIKPVFFLLLFVIPFSIEFDISQQLGTNLPSEPLIVGLLLVTIIFVFLKADKISFRFFSHFLSVMLLFHLIWILVTAIHAEDQLVSIKFFIAKIWYIVVFFFLASLIFRDVSNFRKAFWLIFSSLSVMILVVLVRHAMMGFTFEDVNDPVMPFFKNHVMYATMISVFYPFLFIAAKWYPKGSWKRNLINLAKLVYLVAVYFSFTRAAMLSLVVVLFFLPIVYWKLTRSVIVLSLVGITLVMGYLIHDNTYLKYAPDFEKTVYHDSFDDHIAATVALQDASSMERFYRWIAAAFMFRDKPIMGYGPGNFYPYYKKYTVTSFETYLSENEERSTVHNYLLLILVEQGVIGLLIFIILTFSMLIIGENAYHRLKNKELKRLCLACICALVIVYINLMFSDLIETDKVGSLYFISIAILVNLDLYSRGLLNLTGQKADVIDK